jgi:hypothetical protein
VRGEDGSLFDKFDRRVNKRGYLVDEIGNVIRATNGEIIFRADELDDEDEIPAPFSFEKRKKHLIGGGADTAYEAGAMGTSLGDGAVTETEKFEALDDEDLIEKELSKLKGATHRKEEDETSVESMMGETPSKYNKKNVRTVQQESKPMSVT